MNIFKAITLGTAVAVMVGGCTSNKKYTALQNRYDELSKDYNASQVALAESRANARSLETLLEEARRNNADLKRNYEQMQGSLNQSLLQNQQGSINISKLVDEINASNQYIKQLVQAKSKSDSLNMVLTNNLTRSLSREELKEVDVKVLKGVVYISLADNMLFKSGSYEVNSRAMQTLSKIAKIIKDYGDYDVLVEGNTDNVPISARISATTGISRLCVPRRSYRCFRTTSVSIPRASRLPDAASTTPSPTTIPTLAASVTAARRSS